MEKIELDKNDCAIVFREKDGDFSIELIISKPDGEDEEVSTISVLCTAIGVRLTNDPEFVGEQLDWFDEQMSNMEEDNNEN